MSCRAPKQRPQTNHSKLVGRPRPAPRWARRPPRPLRRLVCRHPLRRRPPRRLVFTLAGGLFFFRPPSAAPWWVVWASPIPALIFSAWGPRHLPPRGQQLGQKTPCFFFFFPPRRFSFFRLCFFFFFFVSRFCSAPRASPRPWAVAPSLLHPVLFPFLFLLSFPLFPPHFPHCLPPWRGRPEQKRKKIVPDIFPGPGRSPSLGGGSCSPPPPGVLVFLCVVMFRAGGAPRFGLPSLLTICALLGRAGPPPSCPLTNSPPHPSSFFGFRAPPGLFFPPPCWLWPAPPRLLPCRPSVPQMAGLYPRAVPIPLRRLPLCSRAPLVLFFVLKPTPKHNSPSPRPGSGC